MKPDRHFVSDHTVRSDLVVVSAPVVSHFDRASSGLKNQLAFRHAARNLPLRLSMKAFSVGLPGREKSRVTPRMKIHKSSLREMNSGPLSRGIVFW